MESIIVALITGGLALIGVIYTNNANNKRVEAQLMTAQAVTDTKIDNLTNEIKRHTRVMGDVPVIETKVTNLENRVGKLEKDVYKI